MNAQVPGFDQQAIGSFELSEDCIKVLGVDGRLEFINCGGLRAMQIPHHDLVLGQEWFGFWPEDVRPMVREMFFASLSGIAQTFEADCPTFAGELRHWRVTLEPRRAPSGMVVSVLVRSAMLPD